MSSVGRGRKCAFGAKILEFCQIGDGSGSKPANVLEARSGSQPQVVGTRPCARGVRRSTGTTLALLRARSEALGAAMRRAAVLPATHRDRRVTEAFESCQNAKLQIAKKCVPAEDPRCADALGEGRGGAASTISRGEARACPRFGCASQQSPSDLMALDSFPPRSAGAGELSGRFRNAGALRMGAGSVRTLAFLRANASTFAERDILV